MAAIITVFFNSCLHREVFYKPVVDTRNATDSVSRCHAGGSEESIELAMRASSSPVAPWIPLRMNYYSDNNITDTANIRGYTLQRTGSRNLFEHVHICGDLLLDAREIQLRWMGILRKDSGDDFEDIWALGYVRATLVADNESSIIFEDSFRNGVLK